MIVHKIAPHKPLRRRITIIRTEMSGDENTLESCDEGAGANLIQLTKEFFMKQNFRNTEDQGLFHLFMFQRRES